MKWGVSGMLAQETKKSTFARSWPVVALVGWCLGIGVCTAALIAYSYRPGRQGEAPARWPQWAEAVHDADKPRLLMFAHPRCPCSSASMAELARLMAAARGRLEATVYFYRPADEQDAWSHSSTWRAAAVIPGVGVRVDPEGRLARRFGAATSGHVVFYDAHDRLRFSGGITLGRGHEGDNTGRSTILQMLDPHRQASTMKNTAVFGCPIYSPSECSQGRS